MGRVKSKLEEQIDSLNQTFTSERKILIEELNFYKSKL